MIPLLYIVCIGAYEKLYFLGSSGHQLIWSSIYGVGVYLILYFSNHPIILIGGPRYSGSRSGFDIEWLFDVNSSGALFLGLLFGVLIYGTFELARKFNATIIYMISFFLHLFLLLFLLYNYAQ